MSGRGRGPDRDQGCKIFWSRGVQNENPLHRASASRIIFICSSKANIPLPLSRDTFSLTGSKKIARNNCPQPQRRAAHLTKEHTASSLFENTIVLKILFRFGLRIKILPNLILLRRIRFGRISKNIHLQLLAASTSSFQKPHLSPPSSNQILLLRPETNPCSRNQMLRLTISRTPSSKRRVCTDRY